MNLEKIFLNMYSIIINQKFEAIIYKGFALREAF